MSERFGCAELRGRRAWPGCRRLAGMAASAAPTDTPTRGVTASPLVVALLALAMAVVAVLVSLAIYSGQTNTRIDGARTEVLAEVRALRTDVSADVASVRADVTAVRGDAADLRADVHALSDRIARIEGALTTGPAPSD